MSTTGQPGEVWWHVHHNVLCETLTEPAEERRRYIRSQKPVGEVPVRLRLFRLIVGQLPEPIARVREARLRLGTYRDRVALEMAWRDEILAMTHYRKEMKALHAKECPNCPWDGKTIFPITKGGT